MKQVAVVAGPAGSGKDSIIRGILARHANTVYAVNATSRPPRPGEVDGVNYFFFSNERFEEEIAKGNIPEHYFRTATRAYYGTYKPFIDKNTAAGKIVLWQGQIVGARYLKENYGATTIFIMPDSPEDFEHRVRARAPMSDIEWAERKEFTEREIREEAPWYDYRITNEDGKLDDAVAKVVDILEKEGYTLAK